MSRSVMEKTQDAVAQNDRRPSSASSKAKAKLMSRFCLSTTDDPLILLNIGGTLMTTRRSTLSHIPNTVLAHVCTSPWAEKITRDTEGRIFLDCDPVVFQYLLSQLRTWSSRHRVFDLPRDPADRERFRSLCHQLHFDSQLTEGIYRQEKFSKICGHVLLDEKGHVARHTANYGFTECRGTNVYSTGIHRIVLTLQHQTIEKYNTFLGIIWSGTPMQEKSFESPTAYGWTGQHQVFLKGAPATIRGYGGYDSDMCRHDTVDLILNCQLGSIALFNHRTRKTYEIEVDLKEGCPLPWQLHVNLYGPEDQVKIITPT